VKSCIRKASYDKRNDLLYLHLCNKTSDNSYGAEENDSFVVMRDMDSDEITGFTVFYPQRNRITVEKKLNDYGIEISITNYI